MDFFKEATACIVEKGLSSTYVFAISTKQPLPPEVMDKLERAMRDALRGIPHSIVQGSDKEQFADGLPALLRAG